jgi:hypothetical protein
VDATVIYGRRELPPNSGVRYVGFVNPSGGSADAFTMAIGHREKDIVVIDAVREVKPPFSPDSVSSEFAETLKSYRVSTVHGDNYAAEWPKERFSIHGIRYERSEKAKSALYQELLPVLNSGRIELLDNVRLIRQLCSLERRTTRGGRDIIDHPPGAGSHDDLVNAIAGVSSILLSRKAPLQISDAVVARSRMPGGGAPYGRPLIWGGSVPSGPPIMLVPDQFGSTSAGEGPGR